MSSIALSIWYLCYLEIDKCFRNFFECAEDQNSRDYSFDPYTARIHTNHQRPVISRRSSLLDHREGSYSILRSLASLLSDSDSARNIRPNFLWKTSSRRKDFSGEKHSSGLHVCPALPANSFTPKQGLPGKAQAQPD